MKTQFARIHTSIPGPKAEQLLQRRVGAVPKGISHVIPTFIESAQGALVRDVDGNQYIDFAGAIGTLNVGHCHPDVVKALQQQTNDYLHPGFNIMMYEPYIELAERLARLAPGSHAKKVMLLNSGAEAVENAVKIARKATGRPGVMVFSGGFHGRTLLTMSMTSKVKPYKYQFGPFAPEVYKAPFPYYYRRPDSMSKEQYDEFLLAEFRRSLLADAAPETLACVVMEPVQGEGGFHVPSAVFVQGVAEICREHGILLIADEIQTAFARTGKTFAMEHFAVVPDLITVSKSLAAGLPLSGVIGRAELMDAAEPGELGGTYSGSPLGCRAALAVLDIMEKERLNERAEQIGINVMNRFREWESRYACIGEARGLGAMCALEIVQDRATRDPDKARAGRIISAANRSGVLMLGAGIHGNVLRLLMPIVITDDQLSEGLDILERMIEREGN